MAEPFHKSSGNVFEDIGFATGEAAELTAKSMLILPSVKPSRDATSRRKRPRAALPHRPAHALQGSPRPHGERDHRHTHRLAHRARAHR